MLWKFAFGTPCGSPIFRKASSLRTTLNIRYFQKSRTSFIKRCIEVSQSSTKQSSNILPKLSLFLTTGGLLKIYTSKIALCTAAKSRLAGYKVSSDLNSQFDWKKFWKYLKPHIWSLLAAIVGALLVALLNIQIPLVMGGVVNILAKYSYESDGNSFISEIKLPALKLVSMYVAQSAFTFFYITMLSNLGEKIAFQMKSDLFSSILQQDIAFFDAQRTGEIITRLTSDVQDFKSSFKQIISGGLRATTQIIGCSISLAMISPYMTCVILLCIPSVIGIGTLFGALLRKTSRNAQAQVEKTTSVADEAVSNIRTVRAFAMEDLEIAMFVTEAEKTMDLNQTLGFGIGLFQAGTNLYLNGSVLMTLYLGGSLLSTNQIKAGEVMSFLMAAQTLQRSLAQVSLLFGNVMKGIAAGGRVFEIILENFNLHIPAGKTIAIVGASGNGKSTIVALLERFYDVDKGAITIDGHDIKSLDPSWMRQKVLGLISQEPILFGTTILENIRYGNPSATDEEVRKAAKMANADDFICCFPKGYNTMVGERGATLSGGQKQRIAIARALLKDPKILLLDEATSALDAESEKIVQAALDNARKGRTVLVIAHRLSTVRNADLILVLDGGKIVEMGTHDQLQQLKGYYWALTFQQHHQAEGA